MPQQNLDITLEAARLVDELRSEHGPVIFHLSGGCCDGSSPMCFPKGEFRLGSQDICLGTVAGAEFWMAKDQYEHWKKFFLTLDVVLGRGSSFSLEIPKGMRFLIRSRMLQEQA